MLLVFSLITFVVTIQCASLARLRPSQVATHLYSTSNRNRNAFSQQMRMNHAGSMKKTPIMQRSPEFYNSAVCAGSTCKAVRNALVENQSQSRWLKARMIFAVEVRREDCVQLHNEYVGAVDCVPDSIYAVPIPGL